MSLRKKSLFVALESTEEKSTVSLEAIALEAEEEMVEMREEAEDIVSDGESIEEAAEDADTLEKIKDTMEESVEEGEGVPEDAAEIAEVAIESIYDRLGLDTSKVMPAMESFGSSSSRVTATKIAIEGIKETLTKVWEGIKNFFKKVWTKIKAFYEKLKLRRKKVAAYIDEVVKTVEATPFDELSLSEDKQHLDNKTLAKKFTINGEADFSTAVQVEESTFKILKASPDIMESMKKAFETILERNTLHEKKSQLSKDLKSIFNFADVSKTDDSMTFEVPNIIGGLNFELTVMETTEDFNITVTTTETDDEAAPYVTAMTPDEIKKAAAIAKEHIVESEEYDKTIKTLESINKTFDNIAKSIAKTLKDYEKKESAEDKAITTTIRKDKAIAKSITNFVSKYTSMVPLKAFDATKSLAQYALVSAKAYH